MARGLVYCTCTDSHRAFSLIICALMLCFSPLQQLHLYLSLPLIHPEWFHTHHLGDTSSPICLSASHSFYLSRSKWLSPTSLHQTDGAFQDPWRWCCSLGGTRWADMFEGCWHTIQYDESWWEKIRSSVPHCCITFTSDDSWLTGMVLLLACLCCSPSFPFIIFFGRHVPQALPRSSGVKHISDIISIQL